MNKKNYQLIEQFYEGFKAADHEMMHACYHQDIQFSDAIFNLQQHEAKAMWHMLCENSKELTLTYTIEEVNDKEGKAYWEAIYIFGKTGYKVHNKVNAKFYFQDNLIIKHTDQFNFWQWSKMALGTTGLALGWVPGFKAIFAKQAKKMLDEFMLNKDEYSQKK